MNKILFKLLGLMSLLLVLNGCASMIYSVPRKVVLKSETRKIPRAYTSPETKSKFVYRYEVIVNSNPEGAEVWSTKDNKLVKLLGKTPLAVVCTNELGDRGLEFFYHYWPANHLEYKRQKVGTTGFPNWYSLYDIEMWFRNIVIKKEGYYDYFVKKQLFGGSKMQSDIDDVIMSFHGKSIEINCSLITLPEKFDEEVRKLIKQKKFKEAEELKEQQITKLVEVIRREGLRDVYVKELKRLKGMGNLADSQLIKLRKDLEKAIETGDYDKANKIKEILEYKEKSGGGGAGQEVDDKAQIYFEQGMAFMSRGHFPNALEAFKKAIEADPTFLDAYVNLATCYSRLGDIRSGIAYNEKALEIKPDYGPAHFNLGASYEVLREYDKARENYQKALREFTEQGGSQETIQEIQKRLNNLL